MSKLLNTLRTFFCIITEIFEYHINGWNAREIAAKLNISERKVYLKQAKSIEILKKKLPKESLLLFIFLCLVLQPADNMRSHRLSSPEEMGYGIPVSK